jgi:hypothetical protein
MSVSSIYESYLYNQFLSSLLNMGESVTSKELEIYLRDNVDDLDLSVPQFDSADYRVSKNENASAVKLNNTIEALKQDLTILYKVFLAFGQGVGEDFQRWKIEVDALDKRLIDLENRIENLLLIAQDTEGYHSYFLDNLTDLFYVDLTNTTVAVDTASQLAFLHPSLSTGQTTTRISLQGLTNDDWSHKVRTFGATIINEQLVEGNGNPPPPPLFDQNEDTFWWIQLRNTQNKPTTIEVNVQISDVPIYISSIYTSLHSAGGNISITPLYSTDNYNFAELPGNTTVIETEGQATFNFESVQAQWVKFVLVRAKANEVISTGDYRFEFGFNEIAFYNEAFEEGESKSFISKPISVTDVDGEVQEFSKVTLEVCEDIPTDTSVKYFVTPGSSSSFSIDSTTKWYSISPVGRANPEYPQVLNLGDITETEIGDTETVSISYSGLASDSDYINPAQSFNILSLDTDNTVLDESITSTGIRFVPAKKGEFILNYQIKDTSYSGSGTGSALNVDEDTFVIFRNIGEKGLTTSNTVRGVQRGWRFEAPYYITLIEVLNDIIIDFGDKEIIIDNQRETGVTKVLGKTNTFDGIHEVKVHKNNWKHVVPEFNSLSELIAADSLYPYNHKLLIEGYDYGSDWLGDVDKIYTGVDLFFECRMKQISLFDLSENLDTSNEYKYFALDRDIANTHTGGNSSTRVFVVKADDTNADLVNERFNIRFDLSNQKYNYLRFRADLETQSSANSPVMGPYKLKFAG